LTLHDPLYLLKIEDGELVLSPILFKTVRNGQEYTLWQHRKTVLKLKLFDVVAYQMSCFKKPIARFNMECRDVIPQAPLDSKILSLFNLLETSDDIDWLFGNAISEYQTYLKSIEEAERQAMEQDNEPIIELREEPKQPEAIQEPNQRQAAQRPTPSIANETVYASAVSASEDTRTVTRTFTAMDAESMSYRTSSKHLSSFHDDYEARSLRKRDLKVSYEAENDFWNYIGERMKQKDSKTFKEQHNESIKSIRHTILTQDVGAAEPLRTVAKKLKTEMESSSGISSFEPKIRQEPKASSWACSSKTWSTKSISRE
jgi:hypothetical protein